MAKKELDLRQEIRNRAARSLAVQVDAEIMAIKPAVCGVKLLPPGRRALPGCAVHTGTHLVCPKCEAAKGGKTTAKKHAGKQSGWGKMGGRPKTKPAAKA